MKNIIYLAILSSLLGLTPCFADQSNESDSSSDEYADIRERLKTCAACHGEKGVSVIPANPILAGQEYYYLYVQLKDIKSGLRHSPIMAPMVADLEKDEMKRLAEYFSKQSWPVVEYEADKNSIVTGKKAVTAGQCVACHLGSFAGNSRVPRLAGQHTEYLNNTMSDFKNKIRKNSPSKGALFSSYSDEDIEGLSKYLTGHKGQ